MNGGRQVKIASGLSRKTLCKTPGAQRGSTLAWSVRVCPEGGRKVLALFYNIISAQDTAGTAWLPPEEVAHGASICGPGQHPLCWQLPQKGWESPLRNQHSGNISGQQPIGSPMTMTLAVSSWCNQHTPDQAQHPQSGHDFGGCGDSASIPDQVSVLLFRGRVCCDFLSIVP